MRTPLLVATASLVITGCAASELNHPAFGPLLETIERRLDLAQAVALHKWDNGQPVQASTRERQVVANVRAAAPEYGLAAERAEAFFADQIEANKLVQYTLLFHWQRVGAAPDEPRSDLQRQIRPQLDQLQSALLRQLADFDMGKPQNCAAELAKAVAGRPVDHLTQQALIRATGQLCDTP